MKRSRWSNFALPLVGGGLMLLAVAHVVRSRPSAARPRPPLATASLRDGSSNQDSPRASVPNNEGSDSIAAIGADASRVAGSGSKTTGESRLAGSGLVEPASENVRIGAHRAGVVAQVLVKAGDAVHRNDRLFCLDDRAMTAELRARQADLAASRAQLSRLDKLPRREQLAPRLARVKEAQAHLAELDDRAQRVARLVATQAVPDDEGVRAQQQREAAAQQLETAKRELELEQAGAWGPDRDVARAATLQAEALVAKTQMELELLCPRAPLDGTVLQVDVRVGEFVGTPPGATLVVLGDTSTLHVRVDFDEADIPRFRRDGRATALLRGAATHPLPLRLVRVEPYVTPKRSLTGASEERVDTRVLQVVYAFATSGDREHTGPLVGQQVDVFVAGSGSGD